MDISQARLRYYAFLGNFLDFKGARKNQADLAKSVDLFLQVPLEEELVKTLKILKQALEDKDFLSLYKQGYTNTFIFNKVSLFYSHYVKELGDGIQGKHLLELRQYLKPFAFKIREDFKESEEYIGFLLLFMEFLIKNNYAQEEQKDFFTSFLKPCIMPLCESLEKEKNIFKDYSLVLKSFYLFDKEFLS